MFEELNWEQIVSFAESGNKYSEYLTVLKQESPHLSIINDNYLPENSNLTSVGRIGIILIHIHVI